MERKIQKSSDLKKLLGNIFVENFFKRKVRVFPKEEYCFLAILNSRDFKLSLVKILALWKSRDFYGVGGFLVCKKIARFLTIENLKSREIRIVRKQYETLPKPFLKFLGTNWKTLKKNDWYFIQKISRNSRKSSKKNPKILKNV